jgi:ribosomal protein S17
LECFEVSLLEFYPVIKRKIYLLGVILSSNMGKANIVRVNQKKIEKIVRDFVLHGVQNYEFFL